MAPSPTGLLHLGNAWSFLLAWLAARIPQGRLILRMEDIDPARSRPEYAEAIVRDLSWLGLDWDEGPGAAVDSLTNAESGPHGPYLQSARGEYYLQALDFLRSAQLAYPCYCTRKELRELASAPHSPAAPYSHLQHWVGDAGAAYPGTCRRLSPAARAEKEAAGRRPAWRLACPEEDTPQRFTDLLLGPQSFSQAACGGDFPLRRSDGVWAYQLAVVVDDALMGVTQVVRGEDILVSTPRQLLLFELLGLPAPSYAHIPLLHDAQGDRLAKRHNSLSLQALREQGRTPESIVGQLAALAGLLPQAQDISAPQLLARLRAEHKIFPWSQLPQGPLRVEEA